MTIERNFDVPFVAAMALREKQIQQNYRPIIAVHKWFARRPGTLFRGLVLSEFSDRPLRECFFESNDFPGRVVADPFIGGGIPLLEANRVGCDVLGFDINPMSTWIVREEIEHLDLVAYRKAADALLTTLKSEIEAGYRTDCPLFGDSNVPVKYFLWVKTLDCERCSRSVDLFPGHLLADDTRHPKHVIVCGTCGQLNEVDNPKHAGNCRECEAPFSATIPARRNRCTCPHCGHLNRFPRPDAGPPTHRMFAIEYHNSKRKSVHRGRFFKRPDARDLSRYAAAAKRWKALEARFVPEQKIPAGDETDRLHRWGYDKYRDLFNDRQLLGLELSCQLISSVENRRIRRALATNLSDLLRYQNMLCRYDTMALKSLDIFSVHGFPVGLVQCESNLLGIVNDSGANVGSGGWSNIVDKYARAKRYCSEPFEVRNDGRKTVVPTKGEWIGERLNGARQRSVSIRCDSSTNLGLTANSLDAVLTDPPYFGNVQYAELMDFCFTWLRGLADQDTDGFDRETTRSPDELTGNSNQARGIEHFTEGLSSVYSSMAHALKPGAPLAFTFHHNSPDAYHAVGVAILDAQLACSATLPCPAEMSGSIHIHGTESSIVDTIFICRKTGQAKRSQLFDNEQQLLQIIRHDLHQLEAAGMKPTHGDIRCITFGHLTRMAIWRLRTGWRVNRPTKEKLSLFGSEMSKLANPGAVVRTAGSDAPKLRIGLFEERGEYQHGQEDAVSF